MFCREFQAKNGSRMTMLQASHDEISRHKCLIYDGHASEQLPVIVPFLLDNLRAKRRCIYLGDPETIQLVDNALTKEGVNISKEMRRGALLFSSERNHLHKGVFEPKEMIESLRGMIDGAVNDGFDGLCATGDMMWEFGTKKNLERLLEYEVLLEQLFHEKPLTGICQYHRDTLPPRTIRDALITHRASFIGVVANPDNLFYVPPELLVENASEAIRDRQGDWMWQQVARIAKAEGERDQARASLTALNQDLENRVRERTRELQSINKELESFCYAVSHDLRAPLRAIQGFSQLLAEDLDAGHADRVKINLERVQSAANRMGQLIEDLLNLSRVSRANSDPTRVNLSAKIETIAENFKTANPERIVEFAIQPGLAVNGDERLLVIALENLMNNALKFSEKRSPAKIEFGMKEQDGEKIYFIKDNGAGFNMAYADKLFGAFQRLHRDDEFPGTGIGLATVQRIIHRHGGRIWADAKEDAGAMFSFTLPT